MKELHYTPGPNASLDQALMALTGARALKVRSSVTLFLMSYSTHRCWICQRFHQQQQQQHWRHWHGSANMAGRVQVLQLQPLGCASISPQQLRNAGQLPLRELRLDSQAFRRASVNRDVHSHLDDRGVRALVDSICQRWSPFQGAPVLSGDGG